MICIIVIQYQHKKYFHIKYLGNSVYGNSSLLVARCRNRCLFWIVEKHWSTFKPHRGTGKTCKFDCQNWQGAVSFWLSLGDRLSTNNIQTLMFLDLLFVAYSEARKTQVGILLGLGVGSRTPPWTDLIIIIIIYNWCLHLSTFFLRLCCCAGCNRWQSPEGILHSLSAVINLSLKISLKERSSQNINPQMWT